MGRQMLATQKRYIALDDLDFGWNEDDVIAFDRMWTHGWDCGRIAQEMRRNPDEVAVLAMDRVIKGAIEPRPGGWFGTKREEK